MHWEYKWSSACRWQHSKWRHTLILTPILLRDIAASSVPPVTLAHSMSHVPHVSSPLQLPTFQYVGVGSDRSSASRSAHVDITNTSDNQGRYFECPNCGESCGEMNIRSVTYCAGHMACHLLSWTHCQSITGMDRWPVTYCVGHIVRHLTALDTLRSLNGM